MGPLYILAVVFAVFFCIAMVIAMYQTVNRLAGIEENLEKISILMTVMATKQGATQEDILAATQEESSVAKKSKK